MFKTIEVRPGVMNIIRDLEAGAIITVTHGDETRDATYTLVNSRHKPRNDVLAAAFVALKDAGLLKENEPGLFEGCGQSFVVVR